MLARVERKQALSILGLDGPATAEQIKEAYRDLAKVWHPDRFPNDPRLQTRAAEQLKQVNLAYSFLRNDVATSKASDSAPVQPPRQPSEQAAPRVVRPQAQQPAQQHPPPGLPVGLVAIPAVLLVVFGIQKSRERTEPASAPVVTTVPQTVHRSVDLSVVPARRPNDAPPSDKPNYFEPKEITSGAVVLYYSACKVEVLKNHPESDAELAKRYCRCVAEFSRTIHQRTGSIKSMNADQVGQQCAVHARDQTVPSFARKPPRDVASIDEGLSRCLADPDGPVQNADAKSGFCMCFLDMILAGKTGASAVEGEQKCVLASAWRSVNGTHLTLKQFQGIRLDATTANTTQATTHSTASQGTKTTATAAPTSDTPAPEEKTVWRWTSNGDRWTLTSDTPAPDEKTEPTTPKTKSTATEVAPEGDAKITMNSLPASNIILDGKSIGSTPKVGYAVAAGEHTVTFNNLEQGLNKTTQVTIAAGETKIVVMKLRD